ncbi:MAG: hypothetical protein WC708_17765, partial [Lentisphaeria bacterium]
RPSANAVLIDGGGTNVSSSSPWDAITFDCGGTDAITFGRADFRHGNALNAGFIDGHVASGRYLGAGSYGWDARTSLGNAFAWPYDAALK